MAGMIAYCGLLCSECAAFKATASGDPAELERVAGEWTEMFGKESGQTLSAEDVVCQGCLGQRERQFAWCAECPIRVCAMARGMANCGYCAAYPCEKLEPSFQADPSVKARLDAVHASRGGQSLQEDWDG